MYKYLTIARVYLAEYLVYRLSFVLWRFRVVLSLLLTYFLWTSVYSARLKVFGYSETQILTYILLIYIIGDLVYSSRIADLSSQIRNGGIINYLLKPFSFFGTMFTREGVDKGLNLAFSFLEVGILVFLLKPSLFLQTDLFTWLLVLVAIGTGMVISFFISFAIALIAFWSTEVWAPRFVFNILITVLAGSYFPLDILPHPFYTVLLLTPFPYFAYLPAKIYLEGASLNVLLLTGVGIIWAGLSYLFAKSLWRRGIREFSFFGR